MKIFSVYRHPVGFSPKYKYKGGEIVMNSSASSIERDLFNFVFRILNREI
jgi:hypothetical protein